ncbi:MAG: hypothetical protein ACTHJ5_10485 [Ilyomonas sp.]
MSKILIINYGLGIGGSEKLVYELACFALKNNIQPTILIPDNYGAEYYDGILEKMGATIVRTRLDGLRLLRNPEKILKALYWKIRLLYFGNKFNSVHVVNLHMAEKVKHLINNNKRYYWHVVSNIQFPGNKLNIDPALFNNPKDTVVFIDDSQAQEIEQQYGAIKCNTMRFKLFLN